VVGVFVRLKLRLLRRGVTRSGVIGVVLFVLMCLLSAAVGVGAGLGAGALIESAADPVLMTSLIFTLVFALWLVIPLFTAGLDETLDPRRFALFPLRGATIVSGLAAAALMGPGALTTALTLGGAARGLGADGPSVAVVVLAVFVALVSSVVWARVVTTTFAAVLASRRGRELGGVLAALLGIAVALGAQQMEGLLTGFADWENPALRTALSWLPPGALGRAAATSADPQSVLWLAYGSLWVLFGLWAWWRGLARLLTSPRSVHAERVRAQRGILALPPRLVAGLLPAGPAGGVAAKELRYLARDGRIRQQLLGAATVVVVLVFGSASEILSSGFGGYLGAVVTLSAMITMATNQFGPDGKTLWGYAVAPLSMGSVLRGKNLALALVVLPAALIGSVVGAAMGDSWETLPGGVFASLAGFLLWLGVGNVLSIYAGYPLPEGAAFGKRTYNGRQAILGLIGLIVAGLLLIPALAAVAFAIIRGGPAFGVVGAIVATVYGAMIWRFGLALSERSLRRRLPELVAVFDAPG
jgi:ABC-2 type transport system permease protein